MRRGILLGKTPFGVAQIAHRHNTPAIVFAGRVGADASILLDHRVDELVAITPAGTPVEEALRDRPAALTRAAAEACRRILSPSTWTRSINQLDLRKR